MAASAVFDGVDDEHRFPVVSLTGALTVAAVLRRGAVLDAYYSIAGHHTSAGVGVFVLQFQSSAFGGLANYPAFFVETGKEVRGAAAIANTTDWYLIAYTKPAGTSTGRFHVKNLTTGAAWSHAAGVATAGVMGDPATQAGGTLRLGEYNDLDDFNGKIGVYGEWAAELSDGQCEALATNKATADWRDHAVAPVVLLEPGYRQPAVVDLTPGRSSSTIINGTTVDVADLAADWRFVGESPPIVHVPRSMTIRA